MQHPLGVQMVIAPAVAEFLLYTPQQRDASHILADLLEAAMQSRRSTARVAGATVRIPFEVRLGEFDDELRRYGAEGL